MTILQRSLPYSDNSADCFARLKSLRHAVYLDSCYPHSTQGRYDIITANPILTIDSSQTDEDPFYLIKHHLQTHQVPTQATPFCGGALGYFSYNLAKRLEKLPNLTQRDSQLPDCIVGIYTWSIVYDHQQKRADLYYQHQADIEPVLDLLDQAPPQNTPFNLLSEFESYISREDYGAAFRKIKDYILAGDIYQANLAQRFSANCSGDTWDAYLRLRQNNPSPFSAYIELPMATLLSCSPERFLQVRERHVQTKPIKGTIARSDDPVRDQEYAQRLLSSTKDKAENLMIVDLLRNDISKNCIPGTVNVPKLFALESFKSVHHLVSTVTGTLQPHASPLDLLRDCFPGGSITGAPKIRAMEIIEECEPLMRHIYCGSIGYVSFDQQMDTNIAIRTLIREGEQLKVSAGGALVADSEEESEYQECLVKLQGIKKALS